MRSPTAASVKVTTGPCADSRTIPCRSTNCSAVLRFTCASIASLGQHGLSCLTTPLECELFNEGRILIKVAVANPPRPYHEIRDAGPAQVAAAFWQSGEIHFLVVRKLGSLWLVRLALVLHRDFACPPNHERTPGIRHQILNLARTLDGIED